MNIAVVILNWNGVQLLEQFLPSVLAYSPEATVYVADNASTDDSVAFVRSNFPSVKIIHNDKNYGFAKGYNQALNNLEADVYALVNSDIEVTPNWLSPIIETFLQEPKTAVIQPKILDFKNKEYFEYAGAAGGFLDKFGYPFCRGRIFDTLEKDMGQYDNDLPIFWASGACFFIRSEVFHELGGFDADFFAHQEEIDLCWRIFNKGYTIKYCHSSKVFHVGGATLQEGSPMKTFLNFRNSLWMLTKNLPLSSFFPILFIRMILDGVAAFRFLLQGKGKHFLMILKAHFYFYWFLPRNLRKREGKQNKQYFKIKSIVYSYYIRSGKVFDRLF
ncbi:glycosyltransferase family 2 protein [Flavobacterium soli]|uniref:glycosyltransferase family 2 protein n=1 Tax=Flavobacterium soli TaxID=344881 RepID=UPI00040FB070|nr:glycosyltransferase [Flavobacterium soli]